MNAPALLTAAEVADILRVDLKTVRRHPRVGAYAFARNLGTQQRPTGRYDSRAMQRWLDSKALGPN